MYLSNVLKHIFIFILDDGVKYSIVIYGFISEQGRGQGCWWVGAGAQFSCLPGAGHMLTMSPASSMAIGQI